MAATIDLAPADIDFTGNGLPFQCNGSQYILEAGVKAIAYFTRIDALIEDDYFTFFDFETGLPFTITAKDTPANTLNEISSETIPGQTAYEAVIMLETDLRAVPIFNRNYKVSSSGLTVTIEARYAYLFDFDDYLIPDCYTRSIEQAGLDRSVRPDYQLKGYISVYPNDNLIAGLNLMVDSSANVAFNIASIIKAYVSNYLPTLSGTQLNFTILKYKFQVGEYYTSGSAIIESQLAEITRYALNGKIDLVKNPNYDVLAQIAAYHPFLNTFSIVDIWTDAVYWLNFINSNSANESVLVKAKIYYTDLTNETQTIYTIATIPFKAYSFAASAYKMNLGSYSPAKEITKYEVWVEHANTTILCAAVTFNIIEKPMFFKQFAYLNRFGMFDYIFAISKNTVSLVLDKTIVTKANGKISDSFNEAYNQIKISTGSLSLNDAMDLQYAFMANEFYEIINNAFVKCIIEPGTFQIVEESASINSIEFSYQYENKL